MLGKRLAELRKKRGLSQYELAKRLGFSRGQIANYEQGQREPDYATLQKLADFFSVSTDYLLGRVDDPDLYSIREEAERAVKKRGIPDLEGLTDEQIKLIEQLIEQMKRGK